MNARTLALAAAHESCPRCGAGRTSEQAYCLSCGLRLPAVGGGLARLRRSWLRRVGWYPGDWMWLPLAALPLALGGAVAAIVLDWRQGATAAATVVARMPAPAVSTPAATGPNGRVRWPAGGQGWTVVLVSEPAITGARRASTLAVSAARRGLPQVGVLDSSDYSSLHPGYEVVFSGIYGSAGDATTALDAVKAAGFGSAYVIRVVP